MPTTAPNPTDRPITPLLRWFLADPDRHITVCAKAWDVSTLWLIAHGRVRASWDNAVKIFRHTDGAVTMAELCGPAGTQAEALDRCMWCGSKPRRRKSKSKAKAKATATRSSGRRVAARTHVHAHAHATASRRGRKAVSQ